jgi:thioredoxin reductase (NADPH)
VADVRNLIIIGSGPAGYTAAVYAARANLNPLVIEGVQSGGALMTTTDVENYPGFPDAVLGPDLMDSMRKQAERFGAELLTDDVTRVDLAGDVKTVWVGDAVYQARAVILATGSAWRPLGVPGEQELLGHGVSSCATCDGFFFRGQHIAVVGGGDSAMEEATFLTRFAESVTIIHRRDAFRASKIMAERALAHPKIKVEWNAVVTEVLGADGKVAGARVKDTTTGEERVLDVTGVFVAIGHDPRSGLFRGQVAMDESGYVQVSAPSTQTSVPGVFAAGDLVDHTYRQAVTAAGTGCAAALDAERFIASLEPAPVATAA